MRILKGSFLSLLNTHLAKAFLLLISFWEEAEVVLKLLLKPKGERVEVRRGKYTACFQSLQRVVFKSLLKVF